MNEVKCVIVFYVLKNKRDNGRMCGTEAKGAEEEGGFVLLLLIYDTE